MGNVWTVSPETTQLDLEWNDEGEVRTFWISVKKRLTIGESRNMLKSISKVSTKLGSRGQEGSAPEANFEWTEYSFARCQTYLVDWALADDQNNKLPITRPQLESLSQEVFEIIDGAIDKHENSLNETESKKTKNSGRKRKATSAS